MSDQFPPPPPNGGPRFQGPPQGQFPPGQFQPGGYGDAKAAAKAAKAYAKAQRPWFKKKRWILGGALAVLVLISAVAGGGGQPSDSTAKDGGDTTASTSGEKGDVTPVDDASTTSEKESEKAEPAPAAKVGTSKNPAPASTAVANKSARYTVDEVEVTDSLGQFADAPSGRYVVVTLTVQNVKDKTIQVSSEDYVLQVDGTEIEPSSNAYVLDDAFSYDDLSPGLKRTGVIVFDVAAENAGKGVLKAQALLSTDKAVYLSLK